MNEKLQQILAFDNVVEFKEKYWHPMSTKDQIHHKSLEKGSYLRLVMMRGGLDIFKYLYDRITHKDDLLIGTDEDKFPIITHLMTANELWKSELTETNERFYEQVFKYLLKQLNDDQLENLKEYIAETDGLLDAVLKKRFFSSAHILIDVFHPEEKVYYEEKIKAATFRKFEEVVTEIPVVLEPVASGMGKHFIETQILDNVFSIERFAGGNQTVDNDVVNAVMQLASYSSNKLKNQDDDIATQKSQGINSLVSELYKAGADSDDPHVRITAMKDLVKAKLDKRDTDENVLLANRSGGYGYERASKFASFFRRPDYKYVDEDNNTYYANSSTEHRLITLLHALENWEEATKDQDFAKHF